MPRASPSLLPLLACIACQQGAAERLDALEARIEALEARGREVGTARKDPETGVLFADLSEAQIERCVVDLTSGAYTALYAYDAAFDEFSDDLSQVGWAPDSPCRWYTATRVVPFTPDGTDIEVEVVVTREPGRGRRFRSGLSNEPKEQPRLSPEELDAYLQQPGWTR